MVGGSVIAHQAGTVDSQYHMQMEHAHILKNLVKGALEEGGVDGSHRNHALLRKAARHGNSMFLRDAHIKIPPGIPAHIA